MLTASTMSATSFCSLISVSDVQGNRIHLSASVGLLTVPGISATACSFCVILHSAVVIYIRLLTVYYVCISFLDAPVATLLAMLWRRFVKISVKIAVKKYGVGLG